MREEEGNLPFHLFIEDVVQQEVRQEEEAQEA